MSNEYATRTGLPYKNEFHKPNKAPVYTPEMDSYKDVENLIYNLIHKYQKRYGGEWDDLLAECNLAFSYAYKTYNPERSKFSTWVYWAVNTCLMENLRQTGRASQIKIVSLEELKKIPSHRHSRNIIDKASELSESARIIAQELAHPCLDVRLNLKILGKRESPRRLRRGVAMYLQDQGWSEREITNGFAELGSKGQL